MKKQVLILIIASMAFIQCSTDDEGNETVNNNQAQIEEAQSVAETGTWRVTNFNDSGQDETSDFTGYTFAFNSDGTLVATNGTITVNGTWSVTDDSNSSSDDSNDDDDDIDFNIAFSVAQDSDFEDLNDDWDIVSITSSKIDLRDVSGGNGGTDLLTFERN